MGAGKYRNKIKSIADFLATLVPEGDCLRGHTTPWTKNGKVMGDKPGLTNALIDVVGEECWNRIAYRLAYPEENIKYKSIGSRCGHTWCCKPEHLWISYDNTDAHNLLKKKVNQG